MDGIDVALIKTDGQTVVVHGPSATFPYSDVFRDKLRQSMIDSAGLDDRTARPGCLTDVEKELTDLHIGAVQSFLEQHDIAAASVDVLGFHGHTVWHQPPAPEPTDGSGLGVTVQIGDGNRLATSLGIPVVFDMRASDVAAGGHGAPLVPVYHRALLTNVSQRPAAIVNVGGVANVTWVGRYGELIAFDTGPGNALIDDFMRTNTNQDCDYGGQFAARGQADDGMLFTLLSHPYFFESAPKSLDRNTFANIELKMQRQEDAVATLTTFTAETIARAVRLLPEEPQLWVITGGGRKNRTMMQMLAERVENAVVPAELLDWPGDALEAEAWAFLAVRSLQELPLTFPGTTGVPHPVRGGVIVDVER